METTPAVITGTDIAQTQDRAAQWVNTWLGTLKATTGAAYAKDLALFTDSLGFSTTPDMAAALLHTDGHAAASNALTEWKAAMLDAELAPSTINRRLSSVRSMVRHAHDGGLIAWLVTIKGVKSKTYRDTRGPGVPAVGRMVETLASADTPKAARDLAILRLMFDLGLRRGEVVALDLGDIDIERCTVMVTGKGRSEAEPITLTDRTCEVLAAWIGHRCTEPGALFTNFDRAGKNGRLTGRSVARIINALGVNVEAGHVTPHGIRHSAITAALDSSNGNTRAAQKFSRHADARTLNVYDDTRTDMAGQLARAISELV